MTYRFQLAHLRVFQISYVILYFLYCYNFNDVFYALLHFFFRSTVSMTCFYIAAFSTGQYFQGRLFCIFALLHFQRRLLCIFALLNFVHVHVFNIALLQVHIFNDDSLLEHCILPIFRLLTITRDQFFDSTTLS